MSALKVLRLQRHVSDRIERRQLAKKAIVTVDNVEQVTWEAEALNAGSKTIHRLGK